MDYRKELSALIDKMPRDIRLFLRGQGKEHNNRVKK